VNVFVLVHSIFSRFLRTIAAPAPVGDTAETTKKLIPLGNAVASVARSEIGRGEEIANNQGDDVVRYRAGRKGSGAWCAAFVSWCAEEACRRLDVAMPFARSGGAKKLYRNIGKAGSFVTVPEAGDVVCWHRGKAGSWQGHIAIVEKVGDDGIIHTIEGNVGRFPAKVKRLAHDVTHERLVGFARFPTISKDA